MSSRPKNVKYLFTTGEGYREWSRYLDREWMPVMSPSEYSCVRFIFDRTAGWQKEWERITLRHFYDGVFTAKEEFWGATNLSKRTVVSVLSKLLERGAIIRSVKTYRDKSRKYSLNYSWVPPVKKRLKPKKIPKKSARSFFDYEGSDDDN